MTFFDNTTTSEDPAASEVQNDQLEVDETEEDFLPRAKERLGVLSYVLIALLIAGLGFLGGVVTQKHNGGSTTTTRRGSFSAGAFAERFSAEGAGAFSGGFGGGTDTGTSGTGTGSDSSSASTPAVIGTIVSVSGDTAVVKNLAGKEVTVKLGSDTTISQSVSASDLKAGQTVTVAGTTGTDGSVTATSVTAK